MLPRRSRSARRGLVLGGAIVLTVGIVAASAPLGAVASNRASTALGTGASVPAIAAWRAAVPAPTDPAQPTPGAPPPTEPASGSPDPTPTQPAPGDPTPSDPAPGDPMPGDPSPGQDPEPTSPASPEPATPLPAPSQSAPPTGGAGEVALTPPGAVVQAPFVSGAPPAPLAPATAAPAALGRVYPTNPWIYNGLEGTRYLDERERSGTEVTRRHMGIDAQGGVRQPIYAVADGVVVGGTWGTTSRDRHGYGNQVEIAHSDGYASRYAHLAQAPVVQQGERVTAGQLIGYMGGSQYGDLTALARHLHFEVTLNGRNVDPLAFLGAATTADEAAAAAATPASAAVDGGSLQLYETRPRTSEGYVSAPTGITVDSAVFAAVDMGGGSAQVMVSDGGSLQQLAVIDGAWRKIDTQLPLRATSIAGANTGTGHPELFAVEDGKLVHIVHDGATWTKTWTGHYFTGTVSAVAMPGGTLHGMLQQAGYLYHLYPAEGGLWNITDTGITVDGPVEAVYTGGRAPEAVTVIDGEVQRVVRGEISWSAVSTGLPASGSLTAVSLGTSWPIALTAGRGAVGMTTVVQGRWTRYTYAMSAPGAIDAVSIGGVGPVLYSVG